MVRVGLSKFTLSSITRSGENGGNLLGEECVMDVYTKIILTLIAVSLVAITFQLSKPAPALAGLTTGPTMGDFLRVKNLASPDERKKAMFELIQRLPMVATLKAG